MKDFTDEIRMRVYHSLMAKGIALDNAIKMVDEWLGDRRFIVKRMASEDSCIKVSIDFQ